MGQYPLQRKILNILTVYFIQKFLGQLAYIYFSIYQNFLSQLYYNTSSKLLIIKNSIEQVKKFLKHHIKIFKNSIDNFYFNLEIQIIKFIQSIGEMTNFDRIMAEFRNLGYNPESYLTFNEVNDAMDTIINKNAHINQFDRAIGQELWQHSLPDNIRGVRLTDYVNSIVEAQVLLRQQLNYTETALNSQKNSEIKAKLQDQYNQIIMDHHLVSAPFRLAPLKPGMPVQVSGQLPPHQSGFRQRLGQTVIFTDKPNYNEDSSTDLRICLIIALFMVLLESVLMFSKHHFLNFLCIFGVLSVFFLNYFDKNYMKFLLLLLAGSILFDAVWLGIHASDYWNPVPHTQYSTLHGGFLGFIYIMVIVQAALKVVIIGILFKYRSNNQNFRKNVSIIGYRFKLDGRETFNPFTPLLRTAPYINAI